MHPAIELIFRTFERRGSQRYGDEAVTQLQHALQAGQLALEAGASSTLVSAALLHDIGHLLQRHDDHAPESAPTLDDQHEALGYQFLQTYFGHAVADPVRLHVVAKRYLCTIDPTYETQLSPTSRQSYYDQGGKMSAEEVKSFESELYFRDALQLRGWDDQAKDPRAETSPLETFGPHLEASVVG